MDADRVKQKYDGESASKYDDRREGIFKWQNEQNAVELILRKILATSDADTLLDIPVGTGRFFEFYRDLSLNVVGMDVSEDMISEATKKISTSMKNISLEKGDILNPQQIDMEPDVLICIRLMHWFNFDEIRQTLKSIDELNANYVIIGIRVFPENDVSLIESIVRKFYRIIRCVIEPIVSREDTRNVHPESKWKREISNNNYSIENRVLVAQSITGSQYYIYLLKDEPGGTGQK